MAILLDRLGSFVNALPGAASQRLIWGIMAIGLYMTYKILEIFDLTVEQLLSLFSKDSGSDEVSDKLLLL